jgi:hypothetical protein
MLGECSGNIHRYAGLAEAAPETIAKSLVKGNADFDKRLAKLAGAVREAAERYLSSGESADAQKLAQALNNRAAALSSEASALETHARMYQAHAKKK